MKQTPSTEFISEDGLAKIYVDNTMPIGVFHDFLMQVKGCMVEKMIKVHKDQQAEIEAQKQESSPEEENK